MKTEKDTWCPNQLRKIKTVRSGYSRKNFIKSLIVTALVLLAFTVILGAVTVALEDLLDAILKPMIVNNG